MERVIEDRNVDPKTNVFRFHYSNKSLKVCVNDETKPLHTFKIGREAFEEYLYYPVLKGNANVSFRNFQIFLGDEEKWHFLCF